MLFRHPLDSVVSDGKLTITVNTVYLYITCFIFSLTTFKVFSSLIFSRLTMMCLGMVFFLLFYLGDN